MIFNSIISKITFVFFITTILFFAVFFAYLGYEQKQFVVSLQTKYTNIAEYIHKNRLPPKQIENFLHPFNLLLTKEPEKLRDKAEIVTQGRGYEILKQNDKYYFHLLTPSFRIMFDDLNSYKKSPIKYFVFGIVFLLLIFIYFLIIKNIKQITLLLDSRQLFLRTVMHELKTPLAKARIVSELIDDEKQKKRLITIFEKLNSQIDDFARIEKIISKNYSINFIQCSMYEIIENAIALLMLENVENKIFTENISQKKLSVDLSLLSMAIKNLIDNGLKYSSDKKIIIEEKDNRVLFISKGKKLEKPLVEYFQPFHNETKSKNHGMGLGLYIVKSILDMHNFTFEYEYQDEKNIFSINYVCSK